MSRAKRLMQASKVLRVAIYIRVSTDMQVEDGVSLDNQLKKLHAFCESQDWTIVKTYADEGVSAKDIDHRPGIQEMINGIENQEFDVVLVYKLDRLVRRVKDLHELLQLMDENEVMFKSATEPFDTTTPAGRLFITMVAAIAEWERETIAERVYDSMKYRAEMGMRNGGPPPYGYYYDESGNLIKNKEQAEVIRLIFDIYKTKGSSTIAKILNKRGYRTSTGSYWSDFAVRAILRQPIYAGLNRWNRRSPVKGKAFTGEEIIKELAQDDFEPIISVEEFEETQKIAASRKNTAFKTDNFFPFSGIAKCPRCGKSFTGMETKKGKLRRFYKCSGKFSLGICDLPMFPEVSFESAFLQALEIQNVADMVEIEKEDRTIDKEEIEKQLKKIKEKKSRARELYIDGDISKKKYNDTISKLSTQELELIKMTEEVQEEVSKDELNLFLSNLKENWSDMSYESQKAALHMLFESITFDVIDYGKKGRYPIPPTLKVRDYAFRQ